MQVGDPFLFPPGWKRARKPEVYFHNSSDALLIQVKELPEFAI